MKKRWIVPNLLAALLWAVLLTACSRQAARPAFPTVTQTGEASIQSGEASITIETVEVTQAVGMRLSGTASLPPTGCLQTGLWIDDQPAGWWPAEVCIEPDAGQWEMVVALGQKETPAQLDPQAHYEIRAWLQNQPDQILASRSFQIEAKRNE